MKPALYTDNKYKNLTVLMTMLKLLLHFYLLIVGHKNGKK